MLEVAQGLPANRDLPMAPLSANAIDTGTALWPGHGIAELAAG
jgi:hypothetical protein